MKIVLLFLVQMSEQMMNEQFTGSLQVALMWLM